MLKCLRCRFKLYSHKATTVACNYVSHPSLLITASSRPPVFQAFLCPSPILNHTPWSSKILKKIMKWGDKTRHAFVIMKYPEHKLQDLYKAISWSQQWQWAVQSSNNISHTVLKTHWGDKCWKLSAEFEWGNGLWSLWFVAVWKHWYTS